nr:MAG TPA: hypothetical protein [Bacteriophage sp.]
MVYILHWNETHISLGKLEVKLCYFGYVLLY